jgi:hypothetical protein
MQKSFTALEHITDNVGKITTKFMCEDENGKQFLVADGKYALGAMATFNAELAD